jgi:hypothetical protein
MTKITTFTKPSLKVARIELDAALAAFTKKTGITVSVGTIRFSEDEFSTRLTAKVTKSTKVNGKTVSIDPMFALQVKTHKLKLTAEGKKLTGYNSRRPKYPFSYVVVKSGAQYKCTPTQAKAIFGK